VDFSQIKKRIPIQSTLIASTNLLPAMMSCFAIVALHCSATIIDHGRFSKGDSCVSPTTRHSNEIIKSVGLHVRRAIGFSLNHNCYRYLEQTLVAVLCLF
jgi:hypothetical protein